MSSTTPDLKPNNHRIHPCPNEKKLSLVEELISKNSGKDIIIVTSGDTKIIEDAIESKDGVKVLDDKTLIKDNDLKCELLISFDLPAKAVIYMARIAHTTSHAVLLINKSEQNLLYPIETLLGRAIKQEAVKGFEYEVAEVKAEEYPSRKPLTRDQIKEVAKKRFEDSTQEPEQKSYEKKSYEDKKPYDKKPYEKSDKKPYDKKKSFDKPDDRWDKKKKEPNKFLGEDENGKSIFSGKSGERNHRHDGTPRDRYDAPKKKGRTIPIKALKKKEDPKSE